MSEVPDGRDPVELTDAAGNTLLMLATYHGHADVVRVLVAAGANPDLGAPSARESAKFFDRPDRAALLPPALWGGR